MSFVDANSLADPTQVRRTILAERHSAAVREVAAQERGRDGVVDKKALDEAQKALAAIEADIQAEYADDPGAEPAEPEPPKGTK